MADEQAPQDEFWQKIYVPVDENWQENGTDFVNPVLVADLFARATGMAAEMSAQAEQITDYLSDQERKLAKLRRQILADNFSKIAKSASTEMVDAFILACAVPSGQSDTLEALDDEIAEWKPRLARIKNRLRVLERNMEWAKQYLDFDKLMQRIATNGRA